MLLPTTFPTASPGEPDKAALIETTTSGSDVPNPTTVTPTTNGEIFSMRDNRTEPRTTSSPPAGRRINPATIRKKIIGYLETPPGLRTRKVSSCA